VAGVYHPDLAAVRWIPRFSYGPRLARRMRGLTIRGSAPGDGVTVEEVVVSPTVSLRVFRPAGASGAVPALLWIHGGGHLFGSPEQDDRGNAGLVRELGVVVAAVRYRLGADAPAPASVEDCYSALVFLVDRAAELGIDPARIAVGGASAGGGVAAGLVLLAHDRGQVEIAFQLLVYPMIDDRTVTRDDLDGRNARMWTPKSNRLGWATYLAAEPGSDGISPYAAPARRDDLSGLPPTWIGVGSVDLFHDEDVEYARRLEAAGVPTQLVIVPGAFHGFDQLFAKKDVVHEFRRSQALALRHAGIAAH
jgi:acetyl esterase/lipase